ncbi:hypothetical protein Tco_1093423 [Tanacetum coccineum]|uniref:Uncharacterized protein n=1 Tax=Tanacetum coccineum TaxID=301880 RepID=A0ABQ5IDX2_9ASTR
MSTYLKHMGGYKHKQLMGKSYDEIQKLFDKEIKRVNTFVAMSSETQESNEKKEEVNEEKAKGSRKKMLGRKRVGKEQQQESSKKQIIEEDKESDKVEEVEEDDKAELKKHLVIKKDDDIAIDAIPRTTKPPVIVDYKLHKEGIMVNYQLIRADGSSKKYSSMIRLLQGIDKEDLETLWKLVKTKHAHDKYHNLEDDEMIKSIFNSRKNKAGVIMKMITDEMKLTTTSTHRSPNLDVDKGESSTPRKYTIIRHRIPPRRSTGPTPPTPIPTTAKANDRILQDTIQLSLAEQKSYDELEAKQNVQKVEEHLIAEEIEKLIEGTENVENAEVDSSTIRKNDNQNDPETRSYMSGHILHVHPTQASPASAQEHQYQLYLTMKDNPRLQHDDLAIWLALKYKFKRLYVSNNPCRSSAVRPRYHDDPHDDAHPEGENSAKRQKTSEHGTYKGNSGPEKIMMSLHKLPAIIFPDDDIEERTSRWVDKCVKMFNPYARYSVEHWKNPHAKIFYTKKQKEPKNPKEVVYSNSKIVQIIKTYWELGHEHKFITEIITRMEKGSIVDDYAETGLLWSLSVFIRSTTIKEKEEIEERLKHHDQMRRWEMYVNGRPLGSRKELLE